jgi:hypothetical protein
LRQPYLQRLSKELMLSYRRLDSASGLAAYLKRSQVTERKRVSSDARWIFAGLGLLAIIAVYLYEPLLTSIRSAMTRSSLW